MGWGREIDSYQLAREISEALLSYKRNQEIWVGMDSSFTPVSDDDELYALGKQAIRLTSEMTNGHHKGRTFGNDDFTRSPPGGKLTCSERRTGMLRL